MNGVTWEILLEAAGTSAFALIVWFLLQQQAKQKERDDNRQAEQKKDDDARSQQTLELVMEVVKSNTSAMTEVRVSNDGIKEAVESIRGFVAQVDRRLASGQGRFDDHEKRLDDLERNSG